MNRRTLLLYVPISALAPADIAQAATKFIATPKVAAPYVTTSELVQGLLTQHFQPSAAALKQAALALQQSLQSRQTSWVKHRPLWVTAMLAWERLAAVAVGPLLERRSARTIDFWPTRPAHIQRQLESGITTSVAQLETIGATARGLPALEWLLWKTDGSGHATAYASLLAEQILTESQALEAGYLALAKAQRDDEDAWILYGEWFGQALGGLDQLRVKKMVPDTRGKDSALWVRGLSNQSAASWQAQAEGIQAFLLGSPAAQAATQAATPGLPVRGSLNSLLLGRGHLRDSKALQERTTAMLRAMLTARPDNAASIRSAQTAVIQVSSLVNSLASGVLTIAIGFTDADGD